MFGYQGICENAKQGLSQGLMVCKSMVTISSDITVPIKLLNPGNDSVVIPKGKILTKFTRINRDCVIKSVNKNTCNFVGNVGLLDSSDDLVSNKVSSESKDGMSSPNTLHIEEFINNFEKKIST